MSGRSRRANLQEPFSTPDPTQATGNTSLLDNSSGQTPVVDFRVSMNGLLQVNVLLSCMYTLDRFVDSAFIANLGCVKKIN